MKIIYIFILLIIVSCNNGSTKLKGSISEEAAIDSISAVYGGNISYSKEIVLIGKNREQEIFHIDLRNSPVLSNFNKYKYLPASNIALIFFSSITEKERKKYFKYKVSVNYENDIKAFEYTSDKMFLVYSSIGKFKTIVKLLKDKNYNGLKSEIYANPLFSFDLNIIIKGLEKIDINYGEIKSSSITGFTFHNTDNGFGFIKVYGFFEREKQNNLFTVFINPQTNNVFKFEYKW